MNLVETSSGTSSGASSTPASLRIDKGLSTKQGDNGVGRKVTPRGSEAGRLHRIRTATSGLHPQHTPFSLQPSAFSLALALALVLGCREAAPPAPSETRPGAGADAPWFQDITKPSGLDFTHQAGTNYFMPDQVGSGIAILDFDGDGRLDVYCVQNDGADPPRAGNQLFQQQPDGTFRNVSGGSGADLAGRGMGAIAGDVNNDGRPDLVVTEYGAVRLLHNLGGARFRELPSAESGLDNPRWAAPASFLDYDRDGWLDLAVGNYVDYDPTHVCHDVQGRQDFCAPGAFAGTAARLWRNVTGTAGAPPRFREVTELAGFTRANGAALAVICADFDGDDWPDVLCSDDGRPNRLFINRRDGTFTEEAGPRGLAYNAMGATAANMGVALADADADGFWDVFITHLSEEFHGFWRQHPRGLFSDQIAATGLLNQAWRGTGFGAVFADWNLDGRPDLALANGLVRRAVPGQTPVPGDVDPWWGRYAQRAQLFANAGQGTFRDITASNPDFCGSARVGRSLALGDLDGDGRPELLLGNIGGALQVYRCTAPIEGHWLGLRLIDPNRGPRDAIGAEVVVRVGSASWWAALQPATSYLVSHAPAIHVGLGSHAKADAVEVLWPDGARETFRDVDADRYVTLIQGKGTPPAASP